MNALGHHHTHGTPLNFAASLTGPISYLDCASGEVLPFNSIDDLELISRTIRFCAEVWAYPEMGAAIRMITPNAFQPRIIPHECGPPNNFALKSTRVTTDGKVGQRVYADPNFHELISISQIWNGHFPDSDRCCSTMPANQWNACKPDSNTPRLWILNGTSASA